MAWTIHIRRGSSRFQHTALELSTALTVACLLLRDGIEVERIEGPDGTQIGIEAIRPMCGETG